MPTALQSLGLTFAAFREQRGLTQEELAEAVSPPSNRSVIAHFEQGRRLPRPAVLSTLCRFLGLPEALWQPFTMASFQRHRVAKPKVANEEVPFSLLAISGLNGSGKTTLAAGLARFFSADLLPVDSIGRRYLGDLAHDPNRWAFEGQLAFLSHKSLQVGQSVEDGRPVVLDRSLSEDIQIYAQDFIENGSIPERSAETYQTVAEFLTRSLPEPDLYVFCRVRPEVAASRIMARRRPDQAMHDEARLRRLANRYEKWLSSLEASRVRVVDAESLDFRDHVVLRRMFYEIDEIVRSKSRPGGQLSLFADLTETTAPPNRLLGHVRSSGDSHGRPQVGEAAAFTPREAPVAYLAAPFTAFANEERDGSEPATPKLIRAVPAHGTIPRSGYRQALLAIERRLRAHGLVSVLPHRDVNAWGTKTLKPEQAMRTCTDHVRACDMIVVLLGMSQGAHYELGIALGMGKPAVVLLPDDLPASFLANGAPVLAGQDVVVLRGRTMAECTEKLASAPVVELLRRHFGLIPRSEKGE